MGWTQAARLGALLSLLLGLAGCGPGRAALPVGARGTVLLSEAPFGGPDTALRLRHYRLRSGLQVLLLRDPQVGVASYRTCLPMGYADDPPGQRGIAHLVEHLVLEQDRGEVLRNLLHKGGGSGGGYTAATFTCYHATAPAEALPLLLRLDAWRMGELRLDDELLLRVRHDVLAQEGDYQADAERLLAARADDLLHGDDLQGARSATWEAELARLRPEELQAFYKRHYVVSSATIIVVGDFEEREILELLEESHGASPPGPPPPRPSQSSRPPETTAQERRLTLRSPLFSRPRLFAAYPGPPHKDRDTEALWVLGELFEERAKKDLVHGPTPVTGVDTELDYARPEANFGITLRLVSKQAPEAAVSLLDGVLTQLEQRPPSAQELERARTAAARQHWLGLETASGRASALAQGQMTDGDPARSSRLAEGLRRVTARDLRRVAERYLRPERRALVFVEPSGDAEPDDDDDEEE